MLLDVFAWIRLSCLPTNTDGMKDRLGTLQMQKCMAERLRVVSTLDTSPIAYDEELTVFQVATDIWGGKGDMPLADDPIDGDEARFSCMVKAKARQNAASLLSSAISSPLDCTRLTQGQCGKIHELLWIHWTVPWFRRLSQCFWTGQGSQPQEA
jgi:hypothetical protein